MTGADARRCAVLAFHKIGEPPAGGWQTWNYIASDIFVQQLTTLAEHGFETIDLDRFLRGLDDPQLLPERSALLTFDDGCRSMLTTATPLLESLGLPAVLFVPTAFVGLTNAFDHGAEPDEPICTWDELRELATRGIAVQAHSENHRTFSELSDAELRHELAASKTTIEQRLDQPVLAFAYPFGDVGGNAERTAALCHETGYRAAFAYLGGVEHLPIEQPFAIARVPMGPDTDLAKQLVDEEHA